MDKPIIIGFGSPLDQPDLDGDIMAPGAIQNIEVGKSYPIYGESGKNIGEVSLLSDGAMSMGFKTNQYQQLGSLIKDGKVQIYPVEHDGKIIAWSIERKTE